MTLVASRPGAPLRGPGGSLPLTRLCLYAAALTPLVFVPGLLFPYVVPKALFLRVAVEVAFLAFLFGFLRGRYAIRSRPEPFLALLAAFVAWNVISAAAGASPWRSFFGSFERMWGVLPWAHFLLLYLLFRCAFDREAWEGFFRVSLLVAWGTCLFALLQRFGGGLGVWVPGGGEGVFATLGNHGYLAAFLILQLTVLPWMWARTERPRRRTFYGASAMLFVWMLLLTGTRAALSGALAGLAVGLSWLILVGRRRVAGWALAGTAVAILGGVLVLVTGLPGAQSLERMAGIAEVPRSLQARFLAWGASLEAFLEHPLLGVGMENFPVAFDRHFDPALYGIKPGSTHWDRAHNAFLDALVTSGAPGLLAYGGAWAALLWGVHRAWARGGLGAGAAAGLLGGLTAYVGYLFFWFADHGSIVQFLAVAGLVGHHAVGGRLTVPAALSGDGAGEGGTGAGQGGARAWLGVGAAAAVLLLLAHQQGVKPWKAARLAGRAQAVAEQEPRRALRLYREALDQGSVQRWEVLVRHVSLIERQAASPSAAAGRPGMAHELRTSFEAAARGLEREIRLDPRNSRVRAKKHQLYRAAWRLTGNTDAYDVAVASLEQAIELSPPRIRYRHVLADAYLEAGEVERAFEELGRARAIYPRFGETYHYLAKAHLVAGRPRTALRWALSSIAMGYAPSDPGLLLAVDRALTLERPGSSRPEPAHGPARAELAALADLHHSYLERRYGAYRTRPAALRAGGEGDREGRAAVFRLAGRDVEVAARLPLLYLGAGETRNAEAAAQRLLVGLLARTDAPAGTLRRVAAFLREVRAGRVERWEGVRSLTVPASGAGEGPP